MAGWIGVDVGSYHHWSDSLHIYSIDAERFSCESAAPLASNTDSLAVDRARGERIILDLYERMVSLTRPDVSWKALEELARFSGAPPSYQNLLLVLGAESARRRDRHDQAAEMMRSCTNPQLLQAWSAWSKQMDAKVHDRGERTGKRKL
jgi:thymidylate synthase